MTTERLQKILARAGVASRRHAEELIAAGRVKVGGRTVTELGSRADPRRDRIEVDGKRVLLEPYVYLVLNKPRDVVCTLRDPEGRPTVGELVRAAPARVVPVGRLDFHTSGVLLLSNDGDFAQALTHPRHESPKTYVAKVRGVVSDEALSRWTRRLVIDGRPTRPAEVRRLRIEGDKTWLELVLREGRNRQIRRLGDAAGYPVMRLSRVAFAGISAEGLRPGQWRHLTADELTDLKKRYGVPRRVFAPPRAATSRATARGVKSGTSTKREGTSGRPASPKRRPTKRDGGSGRPASVKRRPKK